MSVTAERLAHGDLTVQVRPRSDDDAFGHAFAAMIERLRAIIAEMREASVSIASAASQMQGSATRAGDELRRRRAGHPPHRGADRRDEQRGARVRRALATWWSDAGARGRGAHARGRARGAGSDRVDARDPVAHVDDREHRAADEPALAERGDRSGARGRARTRLPRRGGGGAQAGRPSARRRRRRSAG